VPTIVAAILIFSAVLGTCSSFAGDSLTLDQAIQIALHENPLLSKNQNELIAEVKNMEEAGGRLKKALGLAVILLFFSLAPTFRSWINPLTIREKSGLKREKNHEKF